jgi:hypothetical protein
VLLGDHLRQLECYLLAERRARDRFEMSHDSRLSYFIIRYIARQLV